MNVGTGLLIAAGALCLASSMNMNAQIETKTTDTAQKATVTTTVEKGTIVYVQGRDVVIKMQDGSLRHVSNVPDSTKVMVDGKMIGIHDAKVGMMLQRTITTTTVPKTITTTKTVTGTVWHVNPPLSVILTLDDGMNHEFKIPNGQMFMINGTMQSSFHLKKGMKVSATQIVEVPQVDIEKQQKLTGSLPPPPPPPSMDQPIMMESAVPPTPVPQVTEAPAPAPAPALPKTGSPLPLIGLLGFLSLAASFGLKAVRRVS
jgi:hypothetical protein